MFYKIDSAFMNADSYIDTINDEKCNVTGFFIFNDGQLNCKPRFRCQSGYTNNNILCTDLYEHSEDLLIFSERFYNKVHKNLKNEIVFFEADLVVDDQTVKCYVGKVLNIQDIVDLERSDIEYPDDEPYVSKLILRKDINNAEYCVQDSLTQPIIIFTEKFKSLIERENLKIRFIRQDIVNS